jgi:hypothetical protein
VYVRAWDVYAAITLDTGTHGDGVNNVGAVRVEPTAGELQTWQTFGARSRPEAVNQLVSQYIEISLGKVTQRIGTALHNLSSTAK